MLISQTEAVILPLFISKLSLLDDERWVDDDGCDIWGEDLIRGVGLGFMACIVTNNYKTLEIKA